MMTDREKVKEGANRPLLKRNAKHDNDSDDSNDIPMKSMAGVPEPGNEKREETTEEVTGDEEGETPEVALVSPRLSIDQPDPNFPSLDNEDPNEQSRLRPTEEPRISSPHNDIDNAVDVSSFKEKRNYREHLQSVGTDEKAIRNALHENVRKNHVEKVRLICEFIKSKNIPLAADGLLGEKSRESCLCLAVVMGSTESALVLVEFGGQDLVSWSYTAKQHLGITALHLAILNQNLSILESMLSILEKYTKAGLLHFRATGTHFENKFNCACLPLSLAVGIGNMDVLNCLLRHGADLWLGDDVTGNTVLHSLAAIAVHKPQLAVRTLTAILNSEDTKAWWEAKKQEDGSKRFANMSLETALLKAENADGLTPMIYASCLGANQFVQAILNIERLYKFPQWEVGPSSYVLYDVSEIDTAVCESTYAAPPNPVKRHSTERAKALEIFSFVLDDNSLDLGNVPVVKQAMLNKWNAYKLWFFAWMVLHLLVMISFTLSAQFYVRSASDVNATFAGDNSTAPDGRTIGDLLQSPQNQFVLFLDCFVLLVSLIYFVLEVYDVIVLLSKRYWRSRGFDRSRRLKIPAYLTLQYDTFRCLLFLFSVFVLAIFCLKLYQSPWQDFAYAFASIFGWCFMLFFTRAFREIGIFTVMLQRMVTRELFYFAVVFIMITAGFSTATYCLFQETVEPAPEEVSTIGRTFFSFFRLLVGLEDLAISEHTRLPFVMKTIFVMFVLLANILLLNMLIAAMNNTYTQLDNMKELMWLKVRTKAVLLLERRLITPWRPRSNLKTYGRAHQWFLTSEEVTAWHPLAGDTDMVL